MYLIYGGLLDKARRFYFKKIIKKYGIKKGAKVLDYGCGPGDFLLECQKEGIEAYGIDQSERSVELAKERGLNIYLADYRHVPFEENFFDIIILQSVIEHINEPVDTLTSLIKNLKPNGKLVLSSPTPGSHFWDDPTHIRPYTPKSFETLADILQLKIVEINYVFSFLLGIKLKNSLFYKILNLQAFPLGSNIIAIYRKND